MSMSNASKPADYDTCNTGAKALFQAGKFGKAVEAWSNCIKLFPTEYLLYSNRSAAYLKLSNGKQALADAEKVTVLCPSFAKGWHRKGAALEFLCRFKESAECYDKAHALDSSSETYRTDAERVRKILRNSSTAKKDDFYKSQHQTRGKQCFCDGEYEMAVRHYTKGISLDPTDHMWYSNRSACFLKLEQYSSAESDARKCIELFPQYSKAQGRLGYALLGVKLWADAESAFRTGLKLESEETPLKNNSARMSYCAEGLENLRQQKEDEKTQENETLEQEKVEAESAMQNPSDLPMATPNEVCSKCGFVGHTKKDCTTAMTDSRLPSRHAVGYDYCKYCNEIGHTAAQCARRIVNSVKRPREVRCSICNGWNHTAQSCPNREAYGW